MLTDPWEEHYGKGAASWKGSPYKLPDLPEGSRVLDIGCGTGSTLIRAIERGWKVVGVDISPSAIDITRKRLSERGLDCDLRVIDISSGITDIGTFDLIICHYVLGALNSQGRSSAARNIMEILKGGGSLILEDLAWGDVREGKGTLIEERTYRKGNGIVQHFFSIDEVRELFTNLETDVLRVDEWSQAGMVRRRVLGELRKA